MEVSSVERYLPILRVTLGWMYFSAFLRRTVNVPAKLNPSSTAYVGGKLITFLPHAWQPVVGQLEWLLLHPHLLYLFLLLFTAVEGLFGLLMMLGFLTRLSGLVIAILAWSIGAAGGWLGPTCVDEWQIAAVEGAAALMFMFTGSRWLSIDQYLAKKYPRGLRIWKVYIPLW
ncbi:thiosulfate:quinone oxidoreductase large subunit [Vulcanisaeta sp. JCM 16161]|uniref:TQO small subunit DoxD n=1 Tax=Vulcanisaeta sp. JCM 16161 TaxID=1295372 RepID=UPI0006D0A93B|nr:TQO small subunit DoxD [Vulcanisaeta sp. JCM 16161]